MHMCGVHGVFVCVCVCVCVYLCICVFVYLCICVFVHLYISLCVQVFRLCLGRTEVSYMLFLCIPRQCIYPRYDCLITATGAVYTWGDGSSGQLGHALFTLTVDDSQRDELVRAAYGWGFALKCLFRDTQKM